MEPHLALLQVLKSSQKVQAPSYGEVKKLVAVPAPPKKGAPAKAAAKKPAPKQEAPKPKSSSSSTFKLSGPVSKGVQARSSRMPGRKMLCPRWSGTTSTCASVVVGSSMHTFADYSDDARLLIYAG